MLSGQRFGLGGNTTPECWIDGRRMRAAPKARAIAEEAMSSKLGQLGGLHEICSRQALNRGRWPQNEREPRGCILERVEGDRARAAHDLVAIDRRNRCSAATRQSVIGPSAFRARLLSHPTFPPKGGGRRKSRDDRRHCACFFLSLYGQPYRPSVVHNAAPDLHQAQAK